MINKNQVKNRLKTFKNYINGEVNKKVNKRQRKLKLRDLLFSHSASILTDSGCQIGNYHLCQNLQVKVSHQAISKASKTISREHLNALNNGIINNFFKGNSKIRTMAVDGTKISINRKIETDPKSKKFERVTSGNYFKGLVTGVYDIDHKVPLICKLSEHTNERKAFLELLDQIPSYPKPFLIFDRGYYSKEVVNELNKRGYKYLFRMAKDKYQNLLKRENDEILDCLIGKDNLPYYFLTNYLKDSEKVKDLYHLRWQIEEWYKHLKLFLAGNCYSQTSFDAVDKKLLYQQFISLVLGYFKTLLNVKDNYQINLKGLFKNGIKLLTLIFSGNRKSLKLLIENLQLVEDLLIIPKRCERSFPRKSLILKGKWYFAYNRPDSKS